MTALFQLNLVNRVGRSASRQVDLSQVKTFPVATKQESGRAAE